MENFLLEEIYSPEYYHEVEGYDVRIAALKLNDLSNTISEALMSIMYSDINDFDGVDDSTKYIMLRHRIRYAIIDLNNCFDLLMQVPWFLFRAWEHYNVNGSLRTNQLKNKKYEIVRNADNWVLKAEKECSYEKIITFLQSQADSDLQSVAAKTIDFYKTFIDNNRKLFTIRTLTNNIKHRSALKIQELYEPYNFTLNLNGKIISPKELGVRINMPTTFSSADNPNKKMGKAIINYSDDLYIDIEYDNGETFRAVDYTNKSQHYPFNDIYNEVVAYYDEFQELCKFAYSVIERYLHSSTILKMNRGDSSSSINVDKFFIPNK